jgi:ABC-2 type transport system ATP-binding protein
MTETAIRIENLTRDFETVRAVDGLSLEVPAGMIFGFLGPNGAGKTTTLNLLLGLLEPTDGQATVLGFDTQTQADEVRARTGALLEHSGLYEQLTAEDNLEFYGRVYRMPAAERQARIKELLTDIRVWERRKERVDTWSKGMKQKLALARAMLHRPPLVFLDEPTAGLDVMSATDVRDDLESLAAREGVTVFLTTHNMAEAERLCSQVAVIRQGKLVAIGHPDDLRARAGGPRVEIVGRGFSDRALELLRARPEVAAVEVEGRHLEIELREDTDVAPLVSMLVGEGVEVQEVRHGKASLEEVFLTLMEEEK